MTWITDKRIIILIALLLIAAQFVWHQALVGMEEALWWFDEVLHFFGGWLVAALFLSFFEGQEGSRILSEHKFVLLVIVLSFTALIGVMWEFYEYLINYFLQAFEMTLDDTLSDLLMDLLGGLSAGWLYFLIKNRPLPKS